MQCCYQCLREGMDVEGGLGTVWEHGKGEDRNKHRHMQCCHQRLREGVDVEGGFGTLEQHGEGEDCY